MLRHANREPFSPSLGLRGFDDAKIQDVKFVKSDTRPPTPDSGRVLYNKGARTDAAAVAAKQGFLVGTSDRNLVWLRIDSIQGANSSASALMTVYIGGSL